jgi:hypothetical protein
MHVNRSASAWSVQNWVIPVAATIVYVLHRVGYYRHESPLAISRQSLPITVLTASTILVLVTIAIEIMLYNRASLHSGKLLTVIGTVPVSKSGRRRLYWQSITQLLQKRHYSALNRPRSCHIHSDSWQLLRHTSMPHNYRIWFSAVKKPNNRQRANKL